MFYVLFHVFILNSKELMQNNYYICSHGSKQANLNNTELYLNRLLRFRLSGPLWQYLLTTWHQFLKWDAAKVVGFFQILEH